MAKRNPISDKLPGRETLREMDRVSKEVLAREVLVCREHDMVLTVLMELCWSSDGRYKYCGTPTACYRCTKCGHTHPGKADEVMRVLGQMKNTSFT